MHQTLQEVMGTRLDHKQHTVPVHTPQKHKELAVQETDLPPPLARMDAEGRYYEVHSGQSTPRKPIGRQQAALNFDAPDVRKLCTSTKEGYSLLFSLCDPVLQRLESLCRAVQSKKQGLEADQRCLDHEDAEWLRSALKADERELGHHVKWLQACCHQLNQLVSERHNVCRSFQVGEEQSRPQDRELQACFEDKTRRLRLLSEALEQAATLAS